MISISQVALGVHGFNQVLFGKLLGLGVYLLFFYVFDPNVNNVEGLIYVIEYKFKFHILIVLKVLIFGICSFFALSMLKFGFI